MKFENEVTIVRSFFFRNNSKFKSGSALLINLIQDLINNPNKLGVEPSYWFLTSIDTADALQTYSRFHR